MNSGEKIDMNDSLQTFFSLKKLRLMLVISVLLLAISVLIHILSLRGTLPAHYVSRFPVFLLHIGIFPLFFPLVYLNRGNNGGYFGVLFMHPCFILKAVYVIVELYVFIVIFLFFNKTMHFVNIDLNLSVHINELSFFSAVWCGFYATIPNGLSVLIERKKQYA
ncbi:hypothetical protein V1L52_00960 [Treponema sp. HNW]|uniref:hypothetical protein n=1 Tax=Treponema sp. HNW TaxID=3116654 RepID=UPI003D0FE0C2